MNIHSFYCPPVHLLTARHGLAKSGMISTWIVPSTLAPQHPTLLALLSKRSYTAELAMASGQLLLHWLAMGQEHLLPRFALSSGRAEDKFAGLPDVTEGPCGLPFIPGTCGHALGTLLSSLDTGDRWAILLGLSEITLRAGAQPLLEGPALAALPVATQEALSLRYLADQQRDEDLVMKEPYIAQPGGSS